MALSPTQKTAAAILLLLHEDRPPLPGQHTPAGFIFVAMQHAGVSYAEFTSALLILTSADLVTQVGSDCLLSITEYGAALAADIRRAMDGEAQDVKETARAIARTVLRPAN